MAVQNIFILRSKCLSVDARTVVIIRYMIATVSQISRAWKLLAMISCPYRVNSPTPITINRDVSFRLMINWLPIIVVNCC